MENFYNALYTLAMKTFLTLTFLLFPLLGKPQDITEKYWERVKLHQRTMTQQKKILNSVKGYHFILVPGILSETVIPESDQPIHLDILLGDYFGTLIHWLKKSNISYERVIVESESDVMINVSVIESRIRKSTKPIILITHSKGGLESLEVLTRFPKLQEKIVHWFIHQSPFYGAQLADEIAGNRLTGPFAKWLLTFLGGDEKGMTSLMKPVRSKLMKERDYHRTFSDMAKKKKVTNFYTSIENEFGFETMWEISRDLISKSAGRNDGFVEKSSAHIEGLPYIYLRGVDHLSPILDYRALKGITSSRHGFFNWKAGRRNWDFDRHNHYMALLDLVLIKR